MIRHAVGVVGADVGELELLDQKLGELEHLGGEGLYVCGEPCVPRQLGGHGVELAHHAHTGAGGGDDGLVRREDLDEAPYQGYRLALVAGVEVHLAAAGLGEGKLDLVPEPLEHLDGRPAGLGEERVVEAGYEQRYSHDDRSPS
jgi:hypothetical protein